MASRLFENDQALRGICSEVLSFGSRLCIAAPAIHEITFGIRPGAYGKLLREFRLDVKKCREQGHVSQDPYTDCMVEVAPSNTR